MWWYPRTGTALHKCPVTSPSQSSRPTQTTCRIILENSGVAEPQNIRDQFNDAIAMGHPLMKRVYLDTLVTGG